MPFLMLSTFLILKHFALAKREYDWQFVRSLQPVGGPLDSVKTEARCSDVTQCCEKDGPNKGAAETAAL